MAAAPGWKIYDSFDTYQSSCKEVEAAAAVVTFYGPGSTMMCTLQKSEATS